MRAGGTAVSLASNQQLERARYMSQALGYEKAFDACFYSCHLGYAKLDPAYFRAILRASGTPAGEVLFLDDRPANVEAARSTGMQAEVLDIASGVGPFLQILLHRGAPSAQDAR